MTLLQMSLSGTLMILLISGFRLLLQRKIHRNVWMILWLSVVLRLLIPYFLPAASSIYNLPLFHAAQATPQVVPPAESFSAAAAASPISPSFVIKPITLIWLIGAALILLTVVTNHLHHLRRYRLSLPCVASLPTMPNGVRVRILEGLDSPLTYGILKPTILLPSRFPLEDTKRLNHVLQHELSHIRNRDILTKLVLIIAAAVHWFNPFVWLMLCLANQDMEMRCDAQAVSSMGNERIAYAKSLVAAEEDRLYGFFQAGFAHSATERRILALTKDRAMPIFSAMVCIITLLLLGAVFMTGQAKASQNEVLPPAPVAELQETTPKEVPEPQVEEIGIPADEPGDLPPKVSEVTDEEVLPEDPVSEEEPTEAQPQEPVVEEEVSTESEQITQEQSTYTPPAPKPEPYIEPPELDFSLPEMPNNYYADSKPSSNYDPRPPVVVIDIFGDNPGTITEYSPSDPYLSTIGPQPSVPGISFP